MCLKSERSFKKYLLKINVLQFKKQSSYIRYYVQDLYTNISVVAAVLPIMVQTNIILESKFVKI